MKNTSLSEQLELHERHREDFKLATEVEGDMEAEFTRLHAEVPRLREALIEAAEEWTRFVDEDHAPMNIRKWIEREVPPQTDATKEPL